MSIFLSVVAVSALTRAMPVGSPGRWMSDFDYPVEVSRRGQEGSVGVMIVVNPNGSIDQCSIGMSSNIPALDHLACAVIRARAKFTGARDENGLSAHGLYKATLHWRLAYKHRSQGSNDQPLKQFDKQADFILPVEKLPSEVQEQLISVNARIDGAGRVAYCEPDETETEALRLTKIACSQLEAQYVSDLKNAAGKPLPMIRGFRIAFRAQPK